MTPDPQKEFNDSVVQFQQQTKDTIATLHRIVKDLSARLSWYEKHVPAITAAHAQYIVDELTRQNPQAPPT